jgi:hypothetical protein
MRMFAVSNDIVVHGQVARVSDFRAEILYELMRNPAAAASIVAQLRKCCPRLDLGRHLYRLWPFIADW